MDTFSTDISIQHTPNTASTRRIYSAHAQYIQHKLQYEIYSGHQKVNICERKILQALYSQQCSGDGSELHQQNVGLFMYHKASI